MPGNRARLQPKYSIFKVVLRLKQPEVQNCHFFFCGGRRERHIGVKNICNALPLSVRLFLPNLYRFTAFRGWIALYTFRLHLTHANHITQFALLRDFYLSDMLSFHAPSDSKLVGQCCFQVPANGYARLSRHRGEGVYRSKA